MKIKTQDNAKTKKEFQLYGRVSIYIGKLLFLFNHDA